MISIDFHADKLAARNETLHAGGRDFSTVTISNEKSGRVILYFEGADHAERAKAIADAINGEPIKTEAA